MVKNSYSLLCKVVGHNWRYKDYLNWMSESGDDYPFKASRNCIRCNQTEYLFKEWQMADQTSPHDVKKDAHASKQLFQS